MNDKKNMKGFTLVELLAVIVVLAIIMMIAVTSVTGILEKSRKNAFFTTASSFIDAVRNDAIINSTLPACGNRKNVFLSTDLLEKGGKESPFGNPYRYCEEEVQEECSTGNHSYVRISSVESDGGLCKYEYSIFLNDGENAIGMGCSPKNAVDMTADDVGIIGWCDR